MKKKILMIFIITTFGILKSYCQIQDSLRQNMKGDKNLSLLLGYNFWGFHFFEIGFGMNQLSFQDNKVEGSNMFLSTEIKIANEVIFGPKLGLWAGSASGGVGLNLIYYMHSKGEALRLRPEIGLGLSSFKIVYGYNLVLTNKDFQGINRNIISLNVLLRLMTLKKRKF
jgi:hypothetical protein